MSQCILDTRVSLFANALGTDPVGNPTLREILSDIKNGKYKGFVESLRKSLTDGDKPRYEAGKKKLPGFTLSAQLKTRDSKIPLPEKLIAHTHFLQIDIDEVPGQIEFLEASLRNDPRILFFFRSPSGKALKVGVRIDGTRHHDSYLSAEKYFLDEYKVKIDPKVKEVPRLCFVSYDPSPFINEHATILPIMPKIAEPKAAMVGGNPKPIPGKKLSHGERALDTARKMIERSAEGEKLNELLKAGKLLGGYVAGRMVSRSDAESCLKAAIESKPGVNNLVTAYKAIESGLNFGEQLPIDFEDLERERLGYLSSKGIRGNSDSSDEHDKHDKHDSSFTTRQQHDSNSTATRQQHDSCDMGNSWGFIRAWVEESPGRFNIYDLDRELCITERKAKQNRSKCLSSLVLEGVIERDQNTRGFFRKKDSQLNEMDILGAKSEEITIDLPFGLSKEIEINNKEIILIMGETNTGKTAVIFNMIWSCLRTLKGEGTLRRKTDPNNNGHFGLRYFSSEMGPTGVLKKLLAFGKGYSPEEWVEYVASVERNRDFQDVIDPRGFNFIDYLEVFDGEYFKLSSNITAIHTALETGIAVIALQKKKGTDIGRGGEATLEKPRLALALSENKDHGFATVKIVKAKHYRERNPAGLEKDFIVRRRGTKIVEVSEWGYAKDHKFRRDSTFYHDWNLED